ncbi:MAG: leucyl aminopeptidase family protein [Actinobacteria bacterium]|nr:leucyl aminopeptidase family protein [Actinomycetota bacterium]
MLALTVGPSGPDLRAVPDAVLSARIRARIAAVGAIEDRPGALLDLPGSTRLLLVGRGRGSTAEAREAGAAVARNAPHDEPVQIAPRPVDLAGLVEGVILAAYSPRFGDSDERVFEIVGAGRSRVLERSRVLAEATTWTRTMANTPASVETPAWFGERVSDELSPLGIEVIVRDERWLRQVGFGGVLAVGKGSASPPRLVEAHWRGPIEGRGARRPLVLVGKGITFDTGGLQIKSGPNMRSMHTDMSGGAAVIGALAATARLGLPVAVSALVPLAENSFSGSAMLPGEVITHYGGRTSEVTNTDAEGRLVLADALAYAVDRLKPSALVDIATLTGAMKVALGLDTAGLFSTSDEIADGLAEAARSSGEAIWRMPIDTAYESSLRSDVADAINSPGNPGAVTAALFLRHFVGRVPWAHLDIAGPARSTVDAGVLRMGATGFGARLLATWIESMTPTARRR